MYSNFRFRIHEKKMTQRSFAKVLGINPTLLNKYINGFREIPEDIRKQACAILEVEEDWLFRKDM